MFRIFIAFVLLLTVAGCGGKTKEDLYAKGVQELKAGNANGAIVLFKSALEKDQNYIEARFQLGKAYAETGKYEQAEREYEKVLRQNPSRMDVKLELARVHNNMDKPDQAIAEVNEYLKSSPGSAEAFEILGNSYGLQKNYEMSESYFLQAIKAKPDMVSAKLKLAGVYVIQTKIQDAKRVLDDIISSDPKNSQAYYMLADLEAGLGNKEKALEIYQKVVSLNPSDVTALFKAGVIQLENKQLDKADQIADTLLSKFPKRSEGHRLKGMVAYYKKNFDLAITELQSSLKIQQTIGAYYLLGLSHYNRKEYESAVSQFQKILEVNPNNLQARMMLSLVLLNQNRIADSIKEAQRAVETDGKNALAHNFLGNAYLAKGMLEEGMKELNKALELDPKLVDAHLKKGVLKLATGKGKEGEAELESAVKVAPDVLNPRYLLASYYMKQGNTAKAVETLKEGLRGGKSDALLYNAMARIFIMQNKGNDALAYLQKAKQADPDFLNPYFSIASYYVAKKDYSKALDEYRAVLNKKSDNAMAMVGMAEIFENTGKADDAFNYYKKAKETKTSTGYLALAGYYMRKKDRPKSLRILDEAIKADPRNVAALEMKAGIFLDDKKYTDTIKVLNELERISPDRALPLKTGVYILMKDWANAKQVAQKVIENSPKSAHGHTLLASVYENQGNINEAISSLKNGLSLEPQNGKLFLAIGGLYEKKRDFSSALNTYAAALKKDPKFFPAIFGEAAALDVMGKKQEAIKKYNETLKMAPDYVPALNNLAFLYADGYGKKREALDIAAKAARLNPNNPGVIDTLGYAYLVNGKKDEARKLFEKAVTLLPNNPTLHYHLALAYKENGDRSKALNSAQKSLQFGDFPDIAKAKSLVAELKK